MFQIPQSPLRAPPSAGQDYRPAGNLFDLMPSYKHSTEGHRANTAGLKLRSGVLEGPSALPPSTALEVPIEERKVPGMIDKAGRPTKALGTVLFDSPDRRGIKRVLHNPGEDQPTLPAHIHNALAPSHRAKDPRALNNRHAELLASDPRAFYRRDGDFVKYVGNIAQHRLFVSSQPSDLRITPHERAVQRLTKAASESTIRSLQQKILLNNGNTASMDASLLGGSVDSSLLMAGNSTLSNSGNHHQHHHQVHHPGSNNNQHHHDGSGGRTSPNHQPAVPALFSATASDDGSLQFYPMTTMGAHTDHHGGKEEQHHQHQHQHNHYHHHQPSLVNSVSAEELAVKTGQLMAVETTKGDVLTVALPPLPKYLQPVAIQHQQQQRQIQHAATTGLLAASGHVSPRTVAALSGTVVSSGGKWSGTSIKPVLAALENKPPELLQQSLSTNVSNAHLEGVQAAADSTLRNALYAIGRSGAGPSARAGGHAFRKAFPPPAAASVPSSPYGTNAIHQQQQQDQQEQRADAFLRTSLGQPIPYSAVRAGEMNEQQQGGGGDGAGAPSSPRSAFGSGGGSGSASADPSFLATRGLHTREGAAAFNSNNGNASMLSQDLTASASKRRGDPAGLVPTAGGGASTSRSDAPGSYSSSSATAAERALSGSHLVSVVAGHRAAAGTDLPSLRPADVAGAGAGGADGALLFTSRSTASIQNASANGVNMLSAGSSSLVDPATRAGARLHDGGDGAKSLTARAVLAVASKTAHELALGLHGTNDKVPDDLRFEGNAGVGAGTGALGDVSQGSIGMIFNAGSTDGARLASEKVLGAKTMTEAELATSARLLTLGEGSQSGSSSSYFPTGSPSASPPPLSVGHGTTMLPAVAAAATVSAVLMGTGAAPPAEVSYFTTDSSLRHAARAGVTASGVLSTSRPGTATIVGGKEPHPVTGESIESLGSRGSRGRSTSPKAHQVLSATLQAAAAASAATGGRPVVDTSSLLQPALPVAVSDPLSEKVWRQAVSQRRSSIQAKGYSIFEEESQLKAKTLIDATSATGTRSARRSPNRLRIHSQDGSGREGSPSASYRGQDGRPVSPTVARATSTQLIAGDGRYLARAPPTRERMGGGTHNALTAAVASTLDDFEGRLQAFTSTLNGDKSIARRTYEF
jgi:hypothetical protein